MTDFFDPFHAWLGIPPEEQPPNCYRVLGLAPFESSVEAIEHAADQRMVYLKSLASGQHAADAKRLLNHVAAARVRLLDPYKKEMYDQQLREELAKQARAAQQRDAAAREAAGREAAARDVTHIGVGPKQRAPARGPSAKSPAEQTPSPKTPTPRPPASNIPVGQAGDDNAGSVDADTQTATFSSIGQLGEYQLLEKLGEGGMGAVYKAMHTRLRRVVAVKLLPRDRLRDEHAIARFDREMAAVGAVDHPNVVRAMDAREVEGTRFLVMEYVEGLDLTELAKACSPLAVSDVCEIARQAALGLDDIHRHGLVHRDIKPSNLMVTPQGVVKLLDLGLARFQAEDQAQVEVTGAGTAMGTVDYMAPEQIGDARTVDIRADIYSLGCTLYKLLSGRTPFSGERYRTAGEKMAAHLRDAPPPITQHCPGLPQALAVLVMKMLAKDPAKRPGRPSEIADAVGALATTANLAGLVRRAIVPADESELPTVDPQAAKDTESSSTMTRFFRDLGAPTAGTRAATATPHAAPAPGRKRTPLWAAVAGAVAALLLGGLWAVYHFARPSSPRLVLDLPEAEQAGLIVWIDGAQARLPDDGSLELNCPPGEHQVYLTRPGYESPAQKVRVAPGQHLAVTAAWRPLPNLTIPWPAADRQFGWLEVDGAAQDLEALGNRSSLGTIQLTLAPGSHRLTLGRIGYDTIVRLVDVVEGRPETLTPDWRPQGALAMKTDPAAPAPAKLDPAKPDAAKIDTSKPDSPKPEAMAKTDPAKTDATKPEPAKPDVAKPVAAKSDAAKPDAAKAELATQLVAARRRAAAEWARQTAASDARAAAWDFAGAKSALAETAFVDADLTERLRRRRNALDRMAALKAQLIAKINAAEPRPKKSDLGIRGLGGEVTAAAVEGITSQLITGKDELRPWNDLGERALPKLLQYVIDPERVDDWLAGGLVALGANDAVLAERLFDKAKSLGADIAPFVAPLAETALARAETLVAQKKHAEAQTALAALESIQQKHGLAQWHKSNAPLIDALRAAAVLGVANAEAEKLYAEAAELFAQKELFEVKPLVDQIKAKYPVSPAATETARKPSLAEMDKAVAALGKRLVVRQDGKGDFTTIQAALDVAAPNGRVEIDDNGPFYEKLVLSKEGVCLRGRRGRLPLITSLGKSDLMSTNLVTVQAANVALERLALVHAAPTDRALRCVSIHTGPCRVRSVLASIPVSQEGLWATGVVDIESCLLLTHVDVRGTLACRKSLVLGDLVCSGDGFTVDLVTATGKLFSNNAPGACRDAIVAHLQAYTDTFSCERCNVFGTTPFGSNARPGKDTFSAEPMFRDSVNLDYRLLPGSRCLGKAGDGGDIGCRYTPEIIELVKAALDLRSRGAIKF